MSSSDASDNGMVKIMGIVLGALCVFTLICVAMARILGIGEKENDYLMRAAMLDRITPVGQVRTSLPEGVAPTESVAAAPRTAEELVGGACAACHVAGVANAPKLDDAEAWATRRELGLDALVASVVNGKGAMPARGGSDYSDEEIRLAVQQMAGFEPADGDAEAPAAETDAAAEPAEGETAEGETAEGETAAEDSSDTAAALTENVKGAVDGLCSACHISGAGGAPMFNNSEDWEKRKAAGMETLYASVINGKGGMPARGGSQLTDDELKAAVDYLLSKVQ